MMKVLVRLLFVVVLLPSAASAAPIGSVFVFGDSLSDGGNAYLTSGGFYPPSPPYAGRFSNGPTAVERMAALLGVSLQPSAAGGTNYAIGGAATGQVPIPPSGATSTNNFVTTFGLPFSPLFAGKGIDAAVVSFLASGLVFDPATSLFVVWGGPNNFFINPSESVAAQAIVDLYTHVATLYSAGARNFLVPNMPDLSVTPSGRAQTPANQFGLHLLSMGFNAGLKQAMDQLSLLPGMNLVQFDVFGFANNAIANPAAFGLTNVTEACFDQSTFSVCAQPNQYLFWDGAHPTAQAHRLLGNEFAAAVPEPSLWLMLGAGLAGWAARRRRL